MVLKPKYPLGRYWTPLDPSMKETTSSDSIDISRTVPFDEATYLNSADDMPPVLSYIYKLKDYYNTNYDYNFMKIFHVSVNQKKEFGTLMGTLPYKVASEARYSVVPDAKRHKISFSLTSADMTGETTTALVSKTLPEIAGKKLTISYSPSTWADESIIKVYGGLLRAPAYLEKVRPVIKMNDTVILTGPEMMMGSSISLGTTIYSPNFSPDVTKRDIKHGISYAIGLPLLDYPGKQLINQIDAMRALEGTLNDSINAMDSRAGELLNNIAIEYFGQLNNATRSIEGIMHVKNIKMPSIALVGADAYYDEAFGVAMSPPIMKGISIDAYRLSCSPTPLDGDANQRKEFIKQRGLTSSYLEHKILENLLKLDSISAVKALQTAAKNGMPIYKIDKSNITTILPQLTFSAVEKNAIINSVYAGKEVTVHRDAIVLYGSEYVGFIVRDTNTGTGAYMLSSALAGGGTVGGVYNPEFSHAVSEFRVAWFIVGQPTKTFQEDPAQKIWDTSSWWLMTDSVTEMATMPLWQYFGYAAVSIEGADAWWVQYAANSENTWIFYYTGHGWYETKGRDYLSPGNGSILPQQINTDAKIVFLNNCGSAHYGSFVDSFNIDGKHNLGPRKEVLIGFTNESGIALSEIFALEFWLLMGTGLTVEQVRNILIARAIAHPDLSDAYHLSQLRILSKAADSGLSTTLVP